MPQTLYVNDPVAARRRVFLWLALDADGKSPATAETGGQPTFSVNGAAPTNTAGVLVAVSSAQGLYYVELSQANLAALNPLDNVLVLYDSANTVPNAAPCVVDALPHAYQGTAASGTVGTVTLASDASATDDAYNGMVVELYAGTGAPQMRDVADYVGATKVLTPSVNFAPAPDGTTRLRVHLASQQSGPEGWTVGTVNALAAGERTAIAGAVAANATIAGIVTTLAALPAGVLTAFLANTKFGRTLQRLGSKKFGLSPYPTTGVPGSVSATYYAEDGATPEATETITVDTAHRTTGSTYT
jgi:hypothetical protein